MTRAIRLAVLLATLPGCAARSAPPSVPAPAELAAAYRRAILDAATVEPGELLPLRPLAGDSVSVVTWTEHPGSFPPGGVVETAWGDTWVTVEGEVRDACRGFHPEGLHLRLQQLLGLPPTPGARTFAVLRAASRDLFRPCGDPAVGTTACGDSLPAGAPAEHYRFFARQVATAYRYPGGYPWTRLGYTYDWGSRGSEYGASEYVLRRGSRVRVLALHPTEAYCAAQPEPR
jgi:hypothetical protein